jgi:beta-glucosidase
MPGRMRIRRPPRLLPTLALVAAGTALLCGQTPAAAYRNPDLPPEVRARDLVSRMTLDEKVRQMQNDAPAIPALGVPAYNWWSEALHGVARAGRATVFPQAIGLAATWDTDLVHRVADAISTEARAKYNDAIRQDHRAQYFGLTFWSPNINIFRDPRWGRGQETYGEDPYLTGRLAVAFITGMQGADPHYLKVVSTAKHFAVHSGPEPTRHAADVTPSAYDLEHTYLPAFRAAIVDGHADSVMCAYNSVDGLPACTNTDLLQTHLRSMWGFAGYVVSDCGAIGDIYHASAHHFLPTAAEASARAVKAGTDLTCGHEYVSLVRAATNGAIAEADLDAALVRLFTARFRLGMFDPPERVPFSTIPYSEVDSPAHRALALEAARESIVLLKNDRQTLPLRPSVKTVAVIGPSADDEVSLLGNYNGVSSRQVTPLAGIEREFGARAAVRFSMGSTYVADGPVLIPSSSLTSASGEPGVTAEYFDNATLAGAPRLTRREARPSIPLVRDADVAAAGIPASGFAVRWTTVLRPPVTGRYTFATRGGGRTAFRVFIDGRQVRAPGAPASGRNASPPPAPDPIRLDRGRRYALRVEYRPGAGRGTGTGAGDTGIQLMWVPPAGALLADATDVVRHADVAVACIGLNPSLEGEEMTVNVPGFRGGDRTDLALPAPQAALLRAAFATGTPVVVVLTSGSAVAVTSAAARASALLAAWYGGEEIGTAIAETLAGATNPGGRLPVTFYRRVADLPPFADYSMKGRTYRYFTARTLYDFGFGLSYSTFQYSDARVDSTPVSTTVSAEVANTSSRDGDEVVELYVETSRLNPDEPIRELKGFTRIHLSAGEHRTVSFTLDATMLPADWTRVSIGGGQPVPGVPHVVALRGSGG